jgi:uncharacterized protein (DUF433 family)
MTNVINVDPEIMGGTPVFQGTRVPISTLFDFLREPEQDADPIEEFLENFPSVTAGQVADLLEYYKIKADQSRKRA